LVLNYGGFATNGTVTSNTNYNINNGASVTLSGANASLGINGRNYILIHSIADLAAISTGARASSNYAIAQNLDASGQTFPRPVVVELSGTLAGLGHTI